MSRITSYQMSYLLDVNIQRKNSPLIRWIEEKIRTGKGTDYDNYFHEVVEYVEVRLFNSLPPLYYIILADGSLASGLDYRLEKFVENYAKPKQSEIAAAIMVHPELQTHLEAICRHLKLALGKPHSCDIKYMICKEECRCGKKGEVNYREGEDQWFYYCGGSPRCCP